MATLNTDLAALCPSLTPAALKEIIETDKPDAELNVFLNGGWYVGSQLTGLLGDCGGASGQCDVIMWLAAHFLSMVQGQVQSESIGGEYSVTYTGKTGLKLNATRYGQAALTMDCSGVLAESGLPLAELQVIDYQSLMGTMTDLATS